MIINHPQLDNIHGMKIFQNIDERRNIVVTQHSGKRIQSSRTCRTTRRSKLKDTVTKKSSNVADKLAKYY